MHGCGWAHAWLRFKLCGDSEVQLAWHSCGNVRSDLMWHRTQHTARSIQHVPWKCMGQSLHALHIASRHRHCHAVGKCPCSSMPTCSIMHIGACIPQAERRPQHCQQQVNILHRFLGVLWGCGPPEPHHKKGTHTQEWDAPGRGRARRVRNFQRLSWKPCIGSSTILRAA
jgi:hypothetical protein